jgi:hypothetical protein
MYITGFSGLLIAHGFSDVFYYYMRITSNRRKAQPSNAEARGNYALFACTMVYISVCVKIGGLATTAAAYTCICDLRVDT